MRARKECAIANLGGKMLLGVSPVVERPKRALRTLASLGGQPRFSGGWTRGR